VVGQQMPGTGPVLRRLGALPGTMLAGSWTGTESLLPGASLAGARGHGGVRTMLRDTGGYVSCGVWTGIPASLAALARRSS
jgi:hypothetical protein